MRLLIISIHLIEFSFYAWKLAEFVCIIFVVSKDVCDVTSSGCHRARFELGLLTSVLLSPLKSVVFYLTNPKTAHIWGVLNKLFFLFLFFCISC